MQQQRCFAEGAVATQTTVWDELSDLVASDVGKRELATLRSTYADISQKLVGMAKVGCPGCCMAGDRGEGAAWEAELGLACGRAGGCAGSGGRSGGGWTEFRQRSLPRLLLQAQEAINWQEWNKEIDPKLVQQFKQAYESEYGC